MNPIDKLLEVQQCDTRIHELRGELRDIPLRQDAVRDSLRKHRQAVDDAQAALRETLARIKEVEVEAQSRSDKIRKLRQQQMELKTNKEFKAMEDEILGVSREISGFEDRELQFMEDAESTRERLNAAKEDLAREESLTDGDVERLEARKSELEAQLGDLLVRRNGLIQGVDAAWREPYERVLARRVDALVPLQGAVCGGCHMTLPPSVPHDLRKHDLVVTCGYCGRLLYEQR